MNELYEIDDLIAKVLTDEATGAEQAELNRWLAESPTHEKYFADIKQIWTQSPSALDTLDVDTDKAWSKVQKRLHEPPKKLTISWLSMPNLLRIAAIGLVLFAAIQFFNKSPTLENKEIVATTFVSKDSLSDGSKIILNKKSSVTTVFSKKERRVKMVGEAFFNVAHNTEKPFVIEVKTLEIKVVGTSFNVDNLSEAGKIIVTVNTGKVLLRGIYGAETYLEKDEKATYDVATGLFEGKTKIVDKDVVDYKNRLEFDGISLRDVVKQINQLFDTHIEIASASIENCPVSSGYDKRMSLEKYFKEILSESIDLTFEKVGDKIILKGTGCKEE
jgi:transmembrane sensor